MNAPNKIPPPRTASPKPSQAKPGAKPPKKPREKRADDGTVGISVRVPAALAKKLKAQVAVDLVEADEDITSKTIRAGLAKTVVRLLEELLTKPANGD